MVFGALLNLLLLYDVPQIVLTNYLYNQYTLAHLFYLIVHIRSKIPFVSISRDESCASGY